MRVIATSDLQNPHLSESFRRTSILTEGDEELIIFHDVHLHCLTTKSDIIFAVWSLLTSFSYWFKFWLFVKSLNHFLDIMILTFFRWENSWGKQKATEIFLYLTGDLILSIPLLTPGLSLKWSHFLSLIWK